MVSDERELLDVVCRPPLDGDPLPVEVFLELNKGELKLPLLLPLEEEELFLAADLADLVDEMEVLESLL